MNADNKPNLFVVVQDGTKVSNPTDEAKANELAEGVKQKLTEEQQKTANVKVVPVLHG